MITKEEASELQSLITMALAAAHDMEAMEHRSRVASAKLQDFLQKLQQPAPAAPRKSRAKHKAATT